MSSTLTTRIEAVQVDDAEGVRVTYGGKCADILQVTVNGVSNIVAVLCTARANNVHVLLAFDEDGSILGATL
jgi:hypothetical protein